MPSLLLVLLVFVGAVLWTRGVRQNRRRWLMRLDLPGLWLRQDDDGELELGGDYHCGRYRLREGESEHRGDWRLEGPALVLASEAGDRALRLDLRLFKEGTIGLHGSGWEGRIYVKKRGNVVPLRRPA